MRLISEEPEINFNFVFYVDLLHISKSDSDANLGPRSLILDANLRLYQNGKNRNKQINTIICGAFERLARASQGMSYKRATF